MDNLHYFMAEQTNFRKVLLDDKLNDQLERDGFVKIGTFDEQTLSQFRDESNQFIKEIRQTFPKGELFNLINSKIEFKLRSNQIVEKYLNPFVEKKLDMSVVDLYPVSHIIKPFGLKSGIWHQDSAVVNETSDFSLNAWTSLVKSTKLNGCLWVIPGSHRLKNFKRQFAHNPIQGSFLKELRKYMKPLVADAGEVVLFHRNILHGSSRNWLPVRRVAAESLVTSKNAQLVNFHREEALFPNKIIEFKVTPEHFLKENPKEDFYSGNTPYQLHDDETMDEVRAYLKAFVEELKNN